MLFLKDNGGGRSGVDRRKSSSLNYPNDRRSGKDRRDGHDRRRSPRPRLGFLRERRLKLKVLTHKSFLYN